jgi:uncharacterized damage-inducible protein DinB
MKESLITSWRLNNEKNILLLKGSEEGWLRLRLGKGRTVGEQLAHLHNVRITWTEFVAKSIYDKEFLFPKDAEVSLQTLRQAFILSAQKIDSVIDIGWEKEGKLPNFKAGLIPFISYLISHESHHRGNILLTLKQSGIKLPDELKWGLWEWGK